MGQGTHDYAVDERNAAVVVSINGKLLPRSAAMVSIFDSGFILGDGVWEGLRLHKGRIPFLREHLNRLYTGARALDFEIGLTPDELAGQIFACVEANAMADGVHIRLMATRGVKSTPYQDPRVTIGPPTVVIVPEYKVPDPSLVQRGISLFTVHVRRTAPDMQDQKLNSHSKLNCIQACIQATKAGADEALMLDPQGFVATCNATHFFIVREGEVWTSGGGYCLGGITRAAVLRLCGDLGIPAFEKTFSLTDVYGADEAFVTGTFAGLVPVREVDGRRPGDPLRPPATTLPGPVTQRLRSGYGALLDRVAIGPGASI